MRDILTSRVKWSGLGWFGFWAFALLVLPNCGLVHATVGGGTNVNRGSATDPRSSAVFCDIERPGDRPCATSEQIAMGVRLVSAATALASGQTSTFGIDDSPTARGNCVGEPEVVLFQGPFPEGSHVCLNCSVIGPSPAPHADANAVCVAQCLDLFSATDVNVPPSAAAVAFCATHARPSTNFPRSGCIDGACDMGGTLRTMFSDPRRNPEPVDWQNEIGVMATGGTLERTAAATAMWDAGASSRQTIERGDGYVEFIATETNRARMVGLSSGTDTNADYRDIDFGIVVSGDGEIRIFERGSLVSAFGGYPPGQRFRVKVRDNNDGTNTATISYVRVAEPCMPGRRCGESLIYPSTLTGSYPFHVDSSLFDFGATLTDVRLVRIQ